ncbi:tubulin-like doman-containing protein [Streptomyces sp. SAI-149]|uniref:tubulin-like doman-containing protein n=1 Tax=Streptomyces sp. SAI-149 TaxID=2940542 RepID=UPI0024734684|nr:tubulin-like doman-containing protein [Streptomyces sp. SAI-149]
MKIHQPMMFVGLGGTGCLIGAELEQRLREELCGPDGARLVNGSGRSRFQLPECLQFVYADFNEAELNRLPYRRVDRSLRTAYGHTSHATPGLLPPYDSSPDLTRMLRVALHDDVQEWLPPSEHEPRVAPLYHGAGQLPTVARAALFSTLRSGPEPVLAPVREAVDGISRSIGDLRELGGRQLRGCDVFVAFSLAGGTGTGLFYDYMHLVRQAFDAARFPGVSIYPLVIMPSAFPTESGGGREAELNAARAVVDLFHLVDGQNVPTVEPDIAEDGQRGTLSVKYPEMGRLHLRPSTLQTAFLFTRTAGIRPDDLRRSIVSMVLSLIGTENGGETTGSGGTDDESPSFAASFVNRGIHRAARAASGIGRRGVSTSLAASMTVPTDELAELIAGRLLCEAVEDLTGSESRRGEENSALVRGLFVDSGIKDLWERQVMDPPQPYPLPKGKNPIIQTLRGRLETMNDQLSSMDSALDQQVTTLAEGFNPRKGVQELLKKVDPFRAQRVVTGIPGHSDRVAAAGFEGMLANRADTPEKPKQADGTEWDVEPPPNVPQVRRRYGGLLQVHWTDPEVSPAAEHQDKWYTWKGRSLWHKHWREHTTVWKAALERAKSDVDELVRAFSAYIDEGSKTLQDRQTELYRDDRTGVAYLLPPRESFDAFYEDLKGRLLQEERLPAEKGVARLLERMLVDDRWEHVTERPPREAVNSAKRLFEQRVKKLFYATGAPGDRPLLPSLGTLLTSAAHGEKVTEVAGGQWLDVDRFRTQLAGLLPAGFVPEGGGPLKTLIVYPKTDEQELAQQFLKEELQLPSEGSPEFHSAATDSITVVLFRSEMGVTEVPEARQVLRLWAKTRDNEDQGSLLAWRQRTGYGDRNWPIATVADQQYILHRILSAMWNGQVEAVGDPKSPDSLRIMLRPNGAATMTLSLKQYPNRISSWSGLMRAYEDWTLLDAGSITEEMGSLLMGTHAHTPEPSPLFLHLVRDIAPQQRLLLADMSQDGQGDAEDWVEPLRAFWEQHLEAAVRMGFPWQQLADGSAPQTAEAAAMTHMTGEGAADAHGAVQDTESKVAAHSDGSRGTDASAAANGSQVPTGVTAGHGATGVAAVGAAVGGQGRTGSVFTYRQSAAQLQSLHPDRGAAIGGTEVLVTGSGFTADTLILLAGKPVPTTVLDETTMRFRTTTGVPGPATVSATDGEQSSNPLAFTFLKEPSVTSMMPETAPASGGTEVTVSGTGLTGVSAIDMDGTTPEIVTQADGTLTFTAPDHEVGRVPATLIGPDVVRTLAGVLTYIPPAPRVTNLAPDEGTMTGGTQVTISGTDLGSVRTVTFAATPAAAVTRVDDQTIIAVAPPTTSAGVVSITVSSLGGSDTAEYRYLPVPTISGIEPSVGPIKGGTTVTLHGTGFSGATAVTFGGLEGRDLHVVDDNTITVEAPPHVAGTVEVAVTTPNGTSASAPSSYYGFLPATSTL